MSFTLIKTWPQLIYMFNIIDALPSLTYQNSKVLLEKVLEIRIHIGPGVEPTEIFKTKTGLQTDPCGIPAKIYSRSL